MSNKTRKELVNILLKEEMKSNDTKELIDMLFKEKMPIDVDKDSDANRTFGDKLADAITTFAGSWTFIISIVIFLFFWILLNTYLFREFDPFPFVLLNLILSCFSALQAPIILMSQNRAAKKDSLRSSNDYKTDLKSELILKELHTELNRLLINQQKMMKIISSNNKKKK